MHVNERVAIVGLAGRFPGSGADLEAFWKNVVEGRDCAREVPPGRWVRPAADFIHPEMPRADKVPHSRGYYLDEFTPDLTGLEIDAGLVASLDPLFGLVLDVGGRAFATAKTESLARSRAGVILGNICLPTEQANAISRSTFDPNLPKPHRLNRHPTGLPAGLLAKALGFGGLAFTLDAACASTLYAIKLAADELTSGRADLMLAGGASRPDCLYTQMGFAQLRALSPQGVCSPLSAQADGLMVGEGAGLFVLKRVKDALRDGDTIYATLAGAGLSNDQNGNLLAPAKEGQLRAMREAYSRANWKPGDVDFIECHATGTPIGDAIEFESLCELWQSEKFKPGQCAIGSVKSTVGHLLTGAGAAAVTKVLLAMKHHLLPPQANCGTPPAGREAKPFRVLKEKEPWFTRSSLTSRKAAVSGFGFGGVNAHLLLEEWSPEAAEADRSTTLMLSQLKKYINEDDAKTDAIESTEPVAVVGMAAQLGPWRNLRVFQEHALSDAAAEAKPRNLGWGLLNRDSPPGYFLDDAEVPLDRFRIPPKEMEAMLPQQALMLTAAAAALDDCRSHSTPELDLRTGTFIGLGLDFNATNYSLRWSGAAHTPPLTADRVMGALGSIAASRIARAFAFGGPSFTISSEETSAGRAIEVAVRALRNRELDRAVVGGVELTGDPRALLNSPHPEGTFADGAAALVLKRLDDAEAAGDRIYAVISGVGSAIGTTASAHATSLMRACQDGMSDPAKLGWFDLAHPDDAAEREALAALQESTPLSTPLAADCALDRLGQTGFANAAFRVIRSALALYQQILPCGPAYWLANREELPRRAVTACSSVDGGLFHCVLEECPDSALIIESERTQPLGAPGEAVFAIEGDRVSELLDGLDRLLNWLPGEEQPVDGLARLWFQLFPADPRRKLAVSFVVRSVAELREQVDLAQTNLISGGKSPLPDPNLPDHRSRAFFNPAPLGRTGKLAFVFPGSGNQFAGMGRSLGTQWPEVLRRQQRENSLLRDQYSPHLFWRGTIAPQATPRDYLFGQVAVGTLAADLLVHLGVTPQKMIGVSLGESAGLFGLRIWISRDEMYRRLKASTLFTTDLGAPFNSAREFFGLKPGEPFEWISGVIAVGAEDVRAKLRPGLRAYLLIITGPNECVIGGAEADVIKLAASLGKPLLKLEGVTMAHCEAGQPVKQPYHELHSLPIAAFKTKTYSGAWSKRYTPTTQNCADSITAGLLGTIDVPHLIETAYRDGVRAFVEVGPGGSTTRMIDAILGNRPHLARTITAPRQDAVPQILNLLARLIAERFPVSLDKLYGAEIKAAPTNTGRNLRIPVGLWPRSEPETNTEPLPVIVQTPSLSLVNAIAQASSDAGEAHAKFLAVQEGFARTTLAAVQWQMQLIQKLQSQPAPSVPRSLSFEQCQAYAVGRIGDVLGPLFAEADAFPTRVRLPDGPLMLVDRILTIEGEPKSLTRGRVVTDHTVRADRWYLDAGRCPTSITVESGQADLFLSGFLGIDFRTRGLAVYRLLDAVVTFHRGLPKVGETITYDIQIDEFFQQGDSWLFRFRFEGTVSGEPMLSMASGVAGFFTKAALAAGQGIVHTKLDLQPMQGKAVNFKPLVPVQDGSLDQSQVEALRRGDYATAFGPAFANLPLKKPMALPGGMLRLVDRVTSLEPAGGRFGIGFLRAEYDLRPREWFIECHFVDDKVMPGTLMYECCLHSLRILLHRFGWIGEEGTVCEPVPGVASRLKCRGQVLETTKTITYEITIKEIGYRPEAYAIADALMYADGKAIVEISNMSLRMAGVTHEPLERLWLKPETRNPKPETRVYDSKSIMAYSNGKPSEAFGEPYRIFDEGRVIARLPGPPFQFLDRVSDVIGEPFVLEAGASCVAEYRIPNDAWYFAANRSPLMPFSVLLEIALQPCGWLAAYCGSALTSPTDLSFRNLGGQAKQHLAVTAKTGLLTTTVTMTKVSSSVGMIIQHYEMKVMSKQGVVFEGTTYFGFFAKEALRNQVGMPTAKVPFITPEQRAVTVPDVLPHDAPFPEPMLRMVDVIEGWLPHGGRAQLGLVQGRIAVDPGAWFFKAHFFQDPVWPGSLGLESFLQLLKYAAWKKWAAVPADGWQTPALNVVHSWTYRGQVLPTDAEVTVVLEVTSEDRANRRLTADGFLIVDGRIIYQMSDFTLETGNGSS